jgi:hypothetical protein
MIFLMFLLMYGLKIAIIKYLINFLNYLDLSNSATDWCHYSPTHTVDDFRTNTNASSSIRDIAYNEYFDNFNHIFY